MSSSRCRSGRRVQQRRMTLGSALRCAGPRFEFELGCKPDAAEQAQRVVQERLFADEPQDTGAEVVDAVGGVDDRRRTGGKRESGAARASTVKSRRRRSSSMVPRTGQEVDVQSAVGTEDARVPTLLVERKVGAAERLGQTRAEFERVGGNRDVEVGDGAAEEEVADEAAGRVGLDAASTRRSCVSCWTSGDERGGRRTVVAAAHSAMPRRTPLVSERTPLLRLDLHEGFEAGEAVDVEDAVDVVDLVLECLGQEVVLGLDADLLAGGFEALGDDGRGAGHLLDAVAGNREAALRDEALAAALHDLRVDQRERLLFWEPDDDDTQRDADLRRGEAHAVRLVHAVDHVFDELVDGARR